MYMYTERESGKQRLGTREIEDGKERARDGHSLIIFISLTTPSTKHLFEVKVSRD